MNLAIKNEATMSSREIAELIESRHDNVKRTVERCAEKGVFIQPPSEDEQSTDAMGRQRITQIYRLCKRDSLIVVAQLCPEFTARIVDRWQELEQKLASPILHNPRHTALIEMIQKLDHLEYEQDLQARALAETKEVLADTRDKVMLVTKTIESQQNMKTALEFAIEQNLPLDKSSLVKLGRELSSLSRDLDREICTKHQDHAGFRGNVNSFHPDVLKAYLK